VKLPRDQILAALPGLEPADLKAISAALVSLQGGAATHEAPPLKGAQAAVFEALQAATRTPMGWPKFSRSASAKHFAQNAPVFTEFMGRAFGPVAKQRTAALALAKLLVGLLAADMAQRKVPVSMGSLALNLHNVEAAFDRAYPGYVQAGICSIVWARLKQQKQ
jgi:hypothetical protein